MCRPTRLRPENELPVELQALLAEHAVDHLDESWRLPRDLARADPNAGLAEVSGLLDGGSKDDRGEVGPHG